MAYLYKEYLQDYIIEATNEMNKYLGLEPVKDETSESNKDDVYKRNFYLKNNLQDKYVSNVLSNKQYRESIINFTGQFIDDHMEQLSTSGPVYSFVFGDKETALFYDLFKITKEDLLNIWNNMVNETYNGKISKFFTGWIVNAPHKLLFVAITIEAIQKDYKDIVECMEYLWAFCEYPILYAKYFSTGVRKEVMDYTIERLGNKFKIKVKNLNNLLELLKYDGNSALISHYEKLKDGPDNSYADFLYRLRNQIKNTIEKIANVYYVNIEKNATQHDQAEEFDDGSKAEQEGINTNISNIVNNTIDKLNNGEISPEKINIAAEAVKVDKSNLTNFINQIYAFKNNRMERFIEDIIVSYFEKNPTSTNSLSGGAFINFGLSLFKSIGVSKNEIYREIREILNLWMFDIIDIRSLYQREPTVIAYTRAIYNYFIFMINYYN